MLSFPHKNVKRVAIHYFATLAISRYPITGSIYSGIATLQMVSQ